jgi:TolA-binding protein
VKGLVTAALAAFALGACSHEISPLVDPNAKDEVAFQRARVAYDAMMFEDAQAQFDTFVIQWPESARHAEAWYLAGRCRYELGAFGDAIDVLVEMRATYAESRFVENASYYVGRSEYEAERYEEAEAELAAFEVAYPESDYLDDAGYYLGRTFYDRSRYADVIAPLDRVIALATEGFIVPASYYAGRARYETDDLTGAIPDFRRVLEYEEFGMFSDNSQYYIGRSLFEGDDLPGAAIELSVAEITYPESDYMDEIRYWLGRSFYDRAQYADAVGPFERLVTITGTTLRDDGLFMLGRSRYEIGELPGSLVPMQEIESAYPASNFVDNSLYWQSRIYTDLGDCTSAHAAADRLRAQFPTSSELPRADSYMAGHGC